MEDYEVQFTVEPVASQVLLKVLVEAGPIQCVATATDTGTAAPGQ
jgi:hypothetical protein